MKNRLEYQGKKVFITGHTGFKGSWLVSLLHELGAKIKGYALAPYSPSLYDQINGNEFCSSIIHDIMDKQKLRNEVVNFAPDYIFHLAAQPLVLDSYENPLHTFQVNGIGTAHLLEACRELRNKCTVVIVTTDKVYLNNEQAIAFKENDPLGGYDPYSASKACTEIITQSYAKSFFDPSKVRIVTARAGNVIGAGDYSQNRIVPDIVSALKNNHPIVIRNPNALRPWQHVLDCLVGYLLLGTYIHNNVVVDQIGFSTWNFGPNPEDKLTVKELTEIAIKTWGGGTLTIQKDRTQNHEANHLRLDSAKSNVMLDWRPKWNSNQAIDITIKTYKEMSRTNSYELIKANIAAYFD